MPNSTHKPWWMDSIRRRFKEEIDNGCGDFSIESLVYEIKKIESGTIKRTKRECNILTEKILMKKAQEVANLPITPMEGFRSRDAFGWLVESSDDITQAILSINNSKE